MMPPDAQTVHPGRWSPRGDRHEQIRHWLRVNGIDPDHVSSEDPVYVLSVPHHGAGSSLEDDWLIDVICFTQLYVNPNGKRELNYLTRSAARFQRTVPLRVPFPADTTDDGGTHGQAESEPAEEAPQVAIRPPRQAGVSNRHKGEGKKRTRPRGSKRIEKHAEDHSGQGHEEVPQPQKDRGQEERLTA